MSDLAARNTSSHPHWMDGETQKVSQWGQAEIQRVLAKTKAMEEALVAGAKEKQKALDAWHSGELAKLVQEMDQRKAAELKELEDGLQRQIQVSRACLFALVACCHDEFAPMLTLPLLCFMFCRFRLFSWLGNFVRFQARYQPCGV